MAHAYPHITRRLYVNAPLARLQQGLLDTFLAQGLQPEIGLEWDELASFPAGEARRMALALQEHGLSCTLHAPFFDLAPAAGDPAIRAASLAKLRLSLPLAALFRPRALVCHLAYDDKQHRGRQESWLRHALTSWGELVDDAARLELPVHFENTYEYGPEQHQRFLTALDRPNAGFCLDVGHVLAFGQAPLQQWIETLHPWLRHLHLHDNDGSWDEHRAIGSGRVDFPLLLRTLARFALHPMVTLEPHSEDDLWASLAALDGSALEALLPVAPPVPAPCATGGAPWPK